MSIFKTKFHNKMEDNIEWTLWFCILIEDEFLTYSMILYIETEIATTFRKESIIYDLLD